MKDATSERDAKVVKLQGHSTSTKGSPPSQVGEEMLVEMATWWLFLRASVVGIIYFSFVLGQGTLMWLATIGIAEALFSNPVIINGMAVILAAFPVVLLHKTAAFFWQTWDGYQSSRRKKDHNKLQYVGLGLGAVALTIIGIELFAWFIRLGDKAEIIKYKVAPEFRDVVETQLQHNQVLGMALSILLIALIVFGEKQASVCLKAFFERINKRGAPRQWSFWAGVGRFCRWLGLKIRAVVNWIGREVVDLVRLIKHLVVWGLFILGICFFIAKMTVLAVPLAGAFFWWLLLFLLISVGWRRVATGALNIVLYFPRKGVEWLGKHSDLIRGMLKKDDELSRGDEGDNKQSIQPPAEPDQVNHNNEEEKRNEQDQDK